MSVKLSQAESFLALYNNNTLQALAILATRPSLSDEYIHGPLGGVRSNIIGFIPTKDMDCKFSGANWFVQSSYVSQVCTLCSSPAEACILRELGLVVAKALNIWPFCILKT